MANQRNQRILRHKRVAKRLRKVTGVPRLVVFKSNKYIYAQLIDDAQSKTLAYASDLKVKLEKGSKLIRSKKVGEDLAKEATKKNIKKVMFDRAGYKYHGRVKALAEGAREGGLNF